MSIEEKIVLKAKAFFDRKARNKNIKQIDKF